MPVVVSVCVAGAVPAPGCGGGADCRQPAASTGPPDGAFGSTGHAQFHRFCWGLRSDRPAIPHGRAANPAGGASVVDRWRIDRGRRREPAGHASRCRARGRLTAPGAVRTPHVHAAVARGRFDRAAAAAPQLHVETPDGGRVALRSAACAKGSLDRSDLPSTRAVHTCAAGRRAASWSYRFPPQTRSAPARAAAPQYPGSNELLP
jgi:hypothetical protein